MVVPVNANIHKAQNVAEKHRRQLTQVFQFHTMRHLELQNHDGDDDGDHTIAECFQPALAQCRNPMKLLSAKSTEIFPKATAHLVILPNICVQSSGKCQSCRMEPVAPRSARCANDWPRRHS